MQKILNAQTTFQWLFRAHFLKALSAYHFPHCRKKIKGPLRVQIQTINGCNADCLMCPYGKSSGKGSMQVMEDELYTKILKELERSGSTLNLTFMLQNEPFLDRDLAFRVQKARELLGPRTSIAIVTNGSMLTVKRIDEIIRAGVDFIDISIDAYTEETYKKIRPGLDFQAVTHNARLLLQRRNNAHISVRFLRLPQNRSEEDSFKRFWKALGADVRFCLTTNRAGSVENFDQIRLTESNNFRKKLTILLRGFIPPCHDPFHSLNVLWDGRVILCCHDWSPRDVIGNLQENSLSQIWSSHNFNHYRNLLMNWRWKESQVCHDCSVVTDLQENQRNNTIPCFM